MPTIGIDAIAIAVPEGFVELADLATARGVPPAKYVEGLGVTRMAVAKGHEDPVALAANASRRLFSTANIDPSRIGLMVAGTETAVDHSKPVAAYLHRLLGCPSAASVFEAKHACFGGTAGLLAAIDWIASGLGARPSGAGGLHRRRPLRAQQPRRADPGRRRGGDDHFREPTPRGARAGHQRLVREGRERLLAAALHQGSRRRRPPLGASATWTRWRRVRRLQGRLA